MRLYDSSVRPNVVNKYCFFNFLLLLLFFVINKKRTMFSLFPIAYLSIVQQIRVGFLFLFLGLFSMPMCYTSSLLHRRPPIYGEGTVSGGIHYEWLSVRPTPAVPQNANGRIRPPRVVKLTTDQKYNNSRCYHRLLYYVIPKVFRLYINILFKYYIIFYIII